MIVGIKTERFITVLHHTNPAKGYQAFGVEVRSELHATKGWRRGSRRRQLLGSCDYSDAHRARTQGSSISFARAINYDRAPRGVAPIPITEKMLMRHGWYRRQKEREARAAATEAWNNG